MQFYMIIALALIRMSKLCQSEAERTVKISLKQDVKIITLTQ